ncbi:MAG: OmpH family outer membrane protein [Candidatus Aminicenantes bacterium]|nr:OmpH family outer membrane protein [Candidatus Aminicenantes bacterium]
MKRKLTLALVILSLGGFLFSQNLKIAVIDPDKILNESKEGKKILSELQSYYQRKQAEINRRTKEVESLQQKLRTQQGILSQSALQKLADQLDEKQKALKRYVDDANEEMNKLKQKKLAAFQQKMVVIINKVAKRKGILTIFDRRQLIYADPIVDISSEIIAELDKEFEKSMGLGK